MNAPIPPSSQSVQYHDDACEAEPRISRCIALLVGLLAILVLVTLVASTLGLGLWRLTGGYVPFLWPVFPFGLFILFLAIFLIFRFAWWGSGWGARGYWYDGYSAREILQERYARGEISREQLRQMMADIGES